MLYSSKWFDKTVITYVLEADDVSIEQIALEDIVEKNQNVSIYWLLLSDFWKIFQKIDKVRKELAT